MLKQLARLLMEVPAVCGPELSLPRSSTEMCARRGPDAGHKDAFVSRVCWEVNESRSQGGSEAASSACAWRAIRGQYCGSDVSGLSWV